MFARWRLTRAVSDAEFSMKNDELFIQKWQQMMNCFFKNENGSCINNDELCIKNGEFCISLN